MQVGGRAIRMRASSLDEEFSSQSSVRTLLLAHSQALIAETMQTALCSRHPTLEQHFRPDELSTTQESTAGRLWREFDRLRRPRPAA